MTKKHFAAFAAQIKAQYALPHDAGWNAEQSTFYRAALAAIARSFADMAKQTNPRFDRGRFMDACGFTVKEAQAG